MKAALRKLKGVASYYRQGGFGEVLLRLSAYGYLPQSLFSLSKCHLFALDEINPRSLSRPLHGYRFEQGTPAMIDELIACQGKHPDTPRAQFEEFFDTGANCYISRRNGELIAYFWAFQGQYRLRFDAHPRHTLTFRLKDNDVFFGNGFITPTHRLRGVFPRLVDFVASRYPNGRRFSSVNHTNLGSLQAHHRLGFLPLGIVACADIGTVRMFYRQADATGPRQPLGIGPTTIDIDKYLREPELRRLDNPARANGSTAQRRAVHSFGN